ncbi:MAG: hypothetical protein CMO74_11560, partial [Verrucomicrobiales bacterium]|nr:hypothetical protein [Verrucomicrobiales bacterium]
MLKELKFNIIGKTESNDSCNFWWVVQNSNSFEAEIAGRYIWAPKRTKTGRNIHHWSNVGQVKEGDVIFHYHSKKSVQSIVGISIAKADSNTAQRPEGLLESWHKEGWKADLDYYELESPLPKSEINDRIVALDISKGPLTSNGRVNQGYLFGINHAAAQIIAEKINLNSIPQQIMDKIHSNPAPSLNRWLFQFNSKYFDRRAFNELEEISWTIKRKKEREALKQGDLIYIWEYGTNGGIIAIGEAADLPAFRKENPNNEKYNVDKDKFAGEEWRVMVAIKRVLSEPIRRQTCKDHPQLSSLHVLRQPRATNYPVTQEEHQAIQSLLEGIDVMPDTPSEPYTMDDALKHLFMERKLLEDIKDSLSVKKNVILQGPPGVGKTFLARRLAYLLIGAKKRANVEMVQFHQSYAYEDFVQGLRPDPESEQARFKLSNGIFYE